MSEGAIVDDIVKGVEGLNIEPATEIRGTPDEEYEKISIANSRTIKSSKLAIEEPEGDGARVRRSMGEPNLSLWDPFLILDQFKVALPAGFPDHPHRGFETVTYVLPWSKGSMEHEDFTGKKGIIRAGEVQWMTAGKGIVHAEVPSADGLPCEGLQLWINLPKKDKMRPPAYQEFTSTSIPIVTLADKGIEARVIAGSFCGVTGPAATCHPTTYVHFTLQPGTRLSYLLPDSHTAFIYTLKGSLRSAKDEATVYEPSHLLQLSRQPTAPAANANASRSSGGGSSRPAEDGVCVVAGAKGASFVVISGQPIAEPIHKWGPFVLASPEELKATLDDFQRGRAGFQKAQGWTSGIGARVGGGAAAGGRKGGKGGRKGDGDAPPAAAAPAEDEGGRGKKGKRR